MSSLRLTLRTLLAYLDDTLSPGDSRLMGTKVAESEAAGELVSRIRKLNRKRGLPTPSAATDGPMADPNTVAEYLSDAIPAEKVADFEAACLASDPLLAEVAGCHQILTMVLSEPVKLPPSAHQRMYKLVKGKESIPNRRPAAAMSVGGDAADDGGAGADDADAGFLLGMGSVARDGAGRRGLVAALALGGLAGVAAAAYFAVPGRLPDPLSSPRFVAVNVPAAPGTEPAKPAPATTPEKAPEKPPVAATPMTPEKPPLPAAPAGPKPPSAEAVAVGQFLRPARSTILFRKPAAEAPFARVTAAEPGITSTQRLLAFPGYRASLAMRALQLELWGNVPELLPAPLLGVALTPLQPEEGVDAEAALEFGRIYLRPIGEKGSARVRVADQVWDVALADKGTEVAVEVVPQLTPSGDPVAQLFASVSCTRGSATLRANGGPTTLPLKAGEVVRWGSVKNELEGPRKLEEFDLPPGYFAAYALGADAEQTRRTMAALDEAARRLGDASRANVVYAELLDAASGPEGFAAARAGVFGMATLEDWSELAEALADPQRPYVRDAAVYALRLALAARPEGVGRFRAALKERDGLTDDQATDVVRLLRGPTPAQRTDPAYLDKLLEMLASPSIVVRELALVVLVTDVDPASVESAALNRYDAGASDTDRAGPLKAWRDRIAELKKKLAEGK